MKDVKENFSKLNVTHSSSNVTPATDDRKKSLRSNKKKNTQDIIDEAKEKCEVTNDDSVRPIDNNEVFMESCSKLLGDIEAKTHEEQNREKIRNAYSNTVSQIEKEKDRLKICKIDLIYFVNKVKLLLKKTEFQNNPKEAILDHVKSVKEDLKKISNGEQLQFF